MLAHVSPYLILGFGLCVILGNVSAVVAIIGSFTAQRRRSWLLVTALFAVICGSITAIMFIDDGGGIDWRLAICVAPLVLGVVPVIRWMRFDDQ